MRFCVGAPALSEPQVCEQSASRPQALVLAPPHQIAVKAEPQVAEVVAVWSQSAVSLGLMEALSATAWLRPHQPA